MTDIYSKKKRSEIMSKVGRSKTDLEEKVALLLSGLGVRYRRNVKPLAGTPDFVIKSADTVIFVNGCFWHGHSNCRLGRQPKTNVKYWQEKIYQNRRRDRRVARLLRKDGWHVLTIWQCRLRNTDQVARRMKRFLCKS